MRMHAVYLIDPGRRPSVSDFVEALWGDGCDVDLDGNADRPPKDGWTELTVTLRPDYEERVDIDPIDDAEPLVLAIRSERAELVEKAAIFLQAEAGGHLSTSLPIGR